MMFNLPISRTGPTLFILTNQIFEDRPRDFTAVQAQAAVAPLSADQQRAMALTRAFAQRLETTTPGGPGVTPGVERIRAAPSLSAPGDRRPEAGKPGVPDQGSERLRALGAACRTVRNPEQVRPARARQGRRDLGKPAAPVPAVATAANRKQPAKGVDVPDIVDNQVKTLAQEAAAPLDDMVDAIRELLDSVNSLEEFRDRLIEAYPDMNATQLADAMADGMAAASLAGRYDIFRGL